MRALSIAKAARPTVQTIQIPAPVGGLDTVSAASALSVIHAMRLYNVIAAENGLRSRLGYRLWQDGLGDASMPDGDEVRSMLPFHGADSSGNKLFSATVEGIWDSSTDVSTVPEVDFENQFGLAGYCVSTVTVTAAGHFLQVCDEANGLYIYVGSTASWIRPAAGTTQPWEASTTYLIGDLVVNGGNVYVCDTNGVSAASGGPSGTGSNIADNTTRWDYVSAAVTTAIGPSLDDQRAGISVDPEDFVGVVNWKGRTWYVERDTARAWYLGVGSVYGTATSYNFGSKFSQGGAIRNLWNYTRDGGDGMDDFLVAISDGGDVSVYQGTDPDSATTFGPVGFWNVGAVPAGREIASKLGGDLLIIAKQGIVPLSALMVGAADDPSRLATARISNLFNRYMLNASSLRGWAIRVHPEDNALMVMVPTNSGEATNQLAMALANKSWSEYRDLPIFSSCVWNGRFYFGTIEGTVCVMEGYVDDVALDGSSSTAIQCRILSAFVSPGQGRNVQMVGIEPTFLSEAGAVGYNANARYKYDLSELSSATQASGVGWDNENWDTAVWGGDSTTTQRIAGATGQGKEMALAIRFAAVGRTTFVGATLHFNVGGPL